MTFDIKKLSTAFVFVALLTGTVVAEEAAVPAADATTHEAAVIRAHNVFYNLFATNALQAGRGDFSGDVTVGRNLFVIGNETVDGSLTVLGGEEINGCLVIKGCLTQTGGAVNLSNDGIGSAINLGNTATATGATITIGASSSTGANTITIGNASSTGANTVDIGNTNTAASVALHAGTTGKVLYNVGAVTGTNYQLNPVGTVGAAPGVVESAAQRLVRAQIAADGSRTSASGVLSGTAAPATGVFTITWSNTFAAAPTVLATVTGALTGLAIVTTAGANNATITTYTAQGAVALPFNVIAMGA